MLHFQLQSLINIGKGMFMRRRSGKTIGHGIPSTSSHHDEAGPCPICGLNPIRVPYVTCCGHVYCYICLRQALIDTDLNLRCYVCNAKVTSSKPYYMDEIKK